jgi:ATP-dependent Lon protease
MRAVDAPDPVRVSGSRLLPVLPLDDLCLFPGASLALVLDRPTAVSAALLAARCGGHLLALARREGGDSPRDLHSVGTIAAVREIQSLSPLEHRAELDGVTRARADMLVGTELILAEVVPLEEGDEADEWGPAVEALARYLHAHADLRAFLEQQRRSAEAMSWVNLACQHLPITGSARQKLLESSAPERCLRISRGLDALLRKEQTT